MYLLAFQTVQLFPDGTLFIHVGLILLMIWVLNRTLYRPINRIIEARDKSKGGRSTEAVDILKDVNAKESRYTRELLDARTAGYELTEQEQKKAVAAREMQLAEANAEVTAKFESGKADLETQAARARSTIGTEAEKMADTIAANILKS